MTVGNIRSLEGQFLADDNRLSADEAKALIDSTQDWFGVSDDEKGELSEVMVRNADRLDRGADAALRSYLKLGPARADHGPVSVVTGADGRSLADDTVYLGKDGSLHGETGVAAFTRGYASTQAGPLREAHGSPAPRSAVLSPDENARARAATPGASLDAAAAAYGAKVDGFEKLANSKDYFNPEAEAWWGKCHAWAWASLNGKVNELVDVEGPEGQKGVWVAGNWLSRADLGNWMMAVSDSVSLESGDHLFQGNLTATELVKGTTQFLTNKGGGVVSDVFNDAKHGRKEVWNQPFVASDFTTRSLSGPAAAEILRQARGDGAVTGAQVKHLTVVGTYGAEAGDGHEGAPNLKSKTWNLYAVADPNGKLLTAYMADDARLDGVEGLPTRATDEVPEYFWKPKLQAIDDVLAGRRNPIVERDAHGPEFKFFVGTVLARGVPGQTRAAFEAELAVTPEGRVGRQRAADLARKYPGVANAYSPEQWQRTFERRGLDAKVFGAAWQQAR